jgi:hypothetical protein
MALKKSIELNNGVIVNYHRIVSIYKTTNHSTRLEIASYINKDKREQEKEQIANGDDITVYMETEYISLDYDETSNIKDWYAYLKTTEKYGGAEDI